MPKKQKPCFELTKFNDVFDKIRAVNVKHPLKSNQRFTSPMLMLPQNDRHANLENFHITEHDRNCELVYALNFETFKIELLLSSISYKLDMSKCRHYPIGQHSIEVSNLHIIGVTVGDLLKYAWYQHFYNNKSTDVGSSSNNTNGTAENKIDHETKKQNKEILEYCKKSLKIDTSANKKASNFLCALSTSKNSFVEWNMIQQFYEKTLHSKRSRNKLTSSRNVKSKNFAEYCNKLVYLDDIYLNFQSGGINSNKVTAVTSQSKLEAKFNALLSKSAAQRLLGYFLYDEPLVNPSVVYTFETPTSVPDALNLVYQAELANGESNNSLFEQYNLLTKKINNRNKTLVDTKYNDYTVGGGANNTKLGPAKVINDENYYELNKIYVQQLQDTHMNDIYNCRQDYKRLMSNPKFKYKLHQTGKLPRGYEDMFRNNAKRNVWRQVENNKFRCEKKKRNLLEFRQECNEL